MSVNLLIVEGILVRRRVTSIKALNVLIYFSTIIFAVMTVNDMCHKQVPTPLSLIYHVLCSLWHEIKVKTLSTSLLIIVFLVVYGAIIPCTVLYILSALYAYSSFYNHTQAQLIELYSFVVSDGNLILISNILVMTCIIFSIPLAQYPARNTLWKLFYTICPSRFPAVSKIWL